MTYLTCVPEGVSVTLSLNSLAARTIHLLTGTEAPAPKPVTARTGLRLTDLQIGETARILRVAIPDSGCRKRFAELGLAEGMKVTVSGTGDTLMVLLGGSRMALAARCAEEITVARIH